MNKKMFTKLFALVLAVCAILSLAIISSSAADISETITFDANKTQRTYFGADAQIWESNGVIFTNNKAGSSNDVADYSNPVRIYAKSTVTIEAPGNITKIVIASNGTSKYKTALVGALDSAGATYTNSGNNYTITGIDATKFDLTFSAQARFASITVTYAEATDPDAPVCEHENTTITTVESTCVEEGSITETCEACGEVVNVETLDKVDHNYVDGKCSVCGIYSVATELHSGDVVMIVADSYKRALSTTKTGYYNVGFDYSKGTAGLSDNELFYVIVNDDGTYSFTSKSGKSIAMAASNSSLNDTGVNSTWTLTPKSGATGVYNVKNVGRDTYLEWYADKNNWSTYKPSYSLDDQFDISFLLVEAAPAAPEFEKVNVKIGTDLSMLYTVSTSNGAPDKMVFEFNGKTTTVTNYVTNADGTYTFEFAGIGPQQMALNIKATVYAGYVKATFDDYSVEKNLNNIKNAEGASDELVALVNSVLIYGDASENYVGFEGGVDASALENNVAANDATYTLANAETFGFTSANVNFDSVNKITVKFYVEGEFTVTINGVAAEYTEIAENTYAVTTDALTAKQFADSFEFVIEANETKAVLTYSVNAYAAAMKGETAMGALAEALYAYGVNAKAYVA